MPGGGGTADLRHRRVGIAPGESSAHAGQGELVLPAQALEKAPPPAPGPLAQHPGHGQIDEVDPAVLGDEKVAVVQVGQGDAAAMELAQKLARPVEAGRVGPLVDEAGQRPGPDPLGGQGEGSDPAQKAGQPGKARGRPVGRRFAPDQVTPQELADQERTGPVVLEGDLDAPGAVD